MKRLIFFVFGVLILSSLLGATYTLSFRNSYFTEQSWHDLANLVAEVDAEGTEFMSTYMSSLNPIESRLFQRFGDRDFRQGIVSGYYNFFDGTTDVYEWPEEVRELGFSTTEEPPRAEFRYREDFQETRSDLSRFSLLSIIVTLVLAVVVVLLKKAHVKATLGFFSNVFLWYAIINALILLPVRFLLLRQIADQYSGEEEALSTDFFNLLYTHTFSGILIMSAILFVLSLMHKLHFKKKL